MTVEARKKYVDQADADKANYKERVEQYRNTDLYKEYQKRVEKWKQDNENNLKLPS